MMSGHYFVAAFVLLSVYSSVSAHSGLYAANTTVFSKDFSASWLISKSRFIGAEPTISTAVSMASATFSTIRQRCHNCKTLVTRDFFDFMVEHLSSATNQLPNADEQLFEETIRRLQYTAESIKLLGPSSEKDPRVEQTVALLVYSSICFSKHTQLIQRTVRPSFFVATFWSVHRYYKDIVIYVASKEDEEAVMAMDIPYKLLTRLETPFDDKNRTSLLPRDSMLDLLHNMKSDEPFFKKYQYVFFSEGDQILHMREAGHMYDAIDESGGTFITVPHRWQSLTLMQDYPQKHHYKWGAVHAQNIPDVTIAMQDLHETKGSCCQNGDVEVAPCPGWWYQCPNYGIRDFKTWLKFGPTGLTMPPVTEHKATCQYFPERTQCPLPKTCNARFPTRTLPHTPLTPRDVCNEIVDTHYLGFNTAPAVAPKAPVVKVQQQPQQTTKLQPPQKQQQHQPPSRVVMPSKTHPLSVMDDLSRPQSKSIDPAHVAIYTNPLRTEAASLLHEDRLKEAEQHHNAGASDAAAAAAAIAKRPHLESVAELPRKPLARPDRTRPSATVVSDMSDMGPFDRENLESIGENDNSIIRANYQIRSGSSNSNDALQTRKRKNRLRRRNRRIDTVTITANNANNKDELSSGSGGRPAAAGLRVRTMDDIQLA